MFNIQAGQLKDDLPIEKARAEILIDFTVQSNLSSINILKGFHGTAVWNNRDLGSVIQKITSNHILLKYSCKYNQKAWKSTKKSSEK